MRRYGGVYVESIIYIHMHKCTHMSQYCIVHRCICMCVDTHVHIDKLILRIKLQWSDAFSLLMKSIVCSFKFILSFFFSMCISIHCCCLFLFNGSKYVTHVQTDVIERESTTLKSSMGILFFLFFFNTCWIQPYVATNSSDFLQWSFKWWATMS